MQTGLHALGWGLQRLSIAVGAVILAAILAYVTLVVRSSSCRASPPSASSYVRSRRRLWISAWLRIAWSSSSVATTAILFQAPG